jgi:hypothetical protein
MKTLQTPLIPNLLLPDRHIGSIISNIGVAWWERSSEDYEWRLLGLEIGLIGCAGPFTGHFGDIDAVIDWRTWIQWKAASGKVQPCDGRAFEDRVEYYWLVSA